MRTSIVVLLIVITLALPGCETSNTGSWIGAGAGAAAGGLIGGIIGHQSDNKWAGVAIGASIGALAGYIVGTELGATSSEAEKNTSSNYNEARDYFDRANREQDPQKAVDLYQQSINLDPRFPEPHNNMGLRYVQLNRRDLARQSFEKALQVDPSFQPARDNLNRLNYGAL